MRERTRVNYHELDGLSSDEEELYAELDAAAAAAGAAAWGGKRKQRRTGAPKIDPAALSKRLRAAASKGEPRRMAAHDVRLESLRRTGVGFREPIVVSAAAGGAAGLGMALPADEALLTLRGIVAAVGPDTPVDTIECTTQEPGPRQTLEQYAAYLEAPAAERELLLNCVSLPLKGTLLDEEIVIPALVRELDLVEQVWPPPPAQEPPSALLYALLSPAGAYTDFHVDFGGSSVWYHVLSGHKTFLLAPPDAANHAAFEAWAGSSRQRTTFYADSAHDCMRVEVGAGDTVFLPGGWPHAVTTEEDSVVIGGNFLHGHDLFVQLACWSMEDRLGVKSTFRYPRYRELMWFAADRYAGLLHAAKNPGKRKLALTLKKPAAAGGASSEGGNDAKGAAEPPPKQRKAIKLKLKISGADGAATAVAQKPEGEERVKHETPPASGGAQDRAPQAGAASEATVAAAEEVVGEGGASDALATAVAGRAPGAGGTAGEDGDDRSADAAEPTPAQTRPKIMLKIKTAVPEAAPSADTQQKQQQQQQQQENEEEGDGGTQQEKRPGEGGDAGQGSDETPADAKVQGVAQDGGVHLAAAEMPEPAMPDAARASLPVPNGASDGNSISGSITETEMAGLPCLLLTLQQWLGQRTTGALMTKLEARGVVESLYAELGQEAIDRGMEKMAEWFNAREEIAKAAKEEQPQASALNPKAPVKLKLNLKAKISVKSSKGVAGESAAKAAGARLGTSDGGEWKPPQEVTGSPSLPTAQDMQLDNDAFDADRDGTLASARARLAQPLACSVRRQSPQGRRAETDDLCRALLLRGRPRPVPQGELERPRQAAQGAGAAQGQGAPEAVGARPTEEEAQDGRAALRRAAPTPGLRHAGHPPPSEAREGAAPPMGGGGVLARAVRLCTAQSLPPRRYGRPAFRFNIFTVIVKTGLSDASRARGGVIAHPLRSDCSADHACTLIPFMSSIRSHWLRGH